MLFFLAKTIRDISISRKIMSEAVAGEKPISKKYFLFFIII